MSELSAFLEWNTPDLLADDVREASCHWLVLKGLELDPGPSKPNVDLQSLVLPLKSWQLAISTAAFYSSADQLKPGTVQFRIPGGEATTLLFALLGESTSAPTNPLEPAQWLFWLVPTAKLHPDRQSIGLNPLKRAFGEGLTFDALLARLQPKRPVFRIVLDGQDANPHPSDPIAGQDFESYDAAYDVLERYYADLCCSDERSYYRIVERPPA
ncbi:hypothetical protein MY494_01960 [Synechococcus sp. A10-1-5-1]|uniref:hypothetical protein n=1 Tax=Synechococcus sp. A10-1-5-1 TaxID=2936507 RepID=UPI0020017850|nr:hypothetical protein [Synechococcus sp. A10-1-5-1]UPM50585.1 hypothetical protein MY494_01960 [Synechococcus sp. A10-1-5-1]